MSTFDKKQWPKENWHQKRSAQPVADLVSKLLSPVIERRAGMTMDLISAWEYIAGAKHAEQSRPEKLLWPRQINDDDPFEPATLIIACEGGHALFLQHDGDEIVARVNTYFGFAAVSRIKLVQKPIFKPEERTRRRLVKLSAQESSSLDAMLSDVTDPDLKAALEKMGRGVFSKGSPKGG